MVVVLELYREINLRHIRTDGRHIALKGGTHDILVVVDQAVAEADGVDTNTALGVLHRVEHELHPRGVGQHFLSGEHRLVVPPELDNLSATAHHVEVNRVVFSEIDGDTLEIGRYDVQVDCQLEDSFRQELFADNARVEVCTRLVLPRKKEHGAVHSREVLLKRCIDRIVTLFAEYIFGVCVVRKITILNRGFCLCFLVNKAEREHDVCSLSERGLHAVSICLGNLLHKIPPYSPQSTRFTLQFL